MTRRVITAREQHDMLSPWRIAAPDQTAIVHLPLDEVRRYANNWYGPHYKNKWFFDTSKFPDIKQHIEENGIQEPLQVATDGKRAQLWDGYHRLAVADHLGHETVPVEILRKPSSWFQGNHWFNDIYNKDERLRYAPEVPIGETLATHMAGGS